MATFPLWKKADSRGAGKGRDGWGAGKGATAGEREKARRLGSGKRRDGWGAGKGRDGWGAGNRATAGERETALRLGSGKRRDGWGAGNGATARERETARREREMHPTFSSLMVSDERSMSIWRSRMRLSTSAGVRERP